MVTNAEPEVTPEEIAAKKERMKSLIENAKGEVKQVMDVFSAVLGSALRTQLQLGKAPENDDECAKFAVRTWRNTEMFGIIPGNLMEKFRDYMEQEPGFFSAWMKLQFVRSGRYGAMADGKLKFEGYCTCPACTGDLPVEAAELLAILEKKIGNIGDLKGMTESQIKDQLSSMLNGMSDVEVIKMQEDLDAAESAMKHDGSKEATVSMGCLKNY